MRTMRFLVLVVLVGCHGKADADPAPIAVKPVAQPVAKPAEAAAGEDFIADAKLLYRIAACGGTAGSGANVDAKLDKIVDRHCKVMLDKIAKFREVYFDKGR